MDPFRGAEIAGSPGRCPRCLDMPLEPKQARELTIAMCGRCRGVWLDGAGLLELFTASEESLSRLAHVDAVAARDRPEPAPCPRCRRAMLRETGSSGVAYDACSLHGLWFDEGELRALLVYAGIKPGQMNPPPDPPPPSGSGSLDAADVVEGAIDGVDLIVRIIGGIAELLSRTAEEEKKEEPVGSSSH
jgi:Zn-finger nucleic acid-binding protein